jgi:antirestriction protein ArdC
MPSVAKWPIKKSAWLKQYWVFNENQLVSFKGMERTEPKPEIEACLKFDQFVHNTGIKIVPGQSRGAFFNPSQNTVFMQPVHSFIHSLKQKA